MNDGVMHDGGPKNLFTDLPASTAKEYVDVLASSSNVRIERIVSTGQSSADGFWYDQDEHEWVAVLAGEARLSFDDDPEPLTLKPGDHLLIPAHRKHRVEWTSDQEPTVWLAVFFGRDD
ncbi:Cupin domain protein [Stieleria neptunia]|uniref:Cupin domain protein n=1 Tax=Stieleria neptunia TaxID=2527979 RepID=A0A518HHH7_9BACT|nr:cupin domain-containing protein [Stieleria neptunia]QDV40292.1 Cupin domain protein [Stieleria neptunia]